VNRRIAFAVGIQLGIMALVLAQPMLIRSTGTVVYLETEKMDPRALFRGDYVILGYRVAQGILSEEQEQKAKSRAAPVYVTVSTERPGRLLGVSLEKPLLEEGQACIVGRARGWDGAVDFPQVAQFFVPEDTGRALESARGENLLAKIAASQSCKAVLLGLEPR
jgi:uncharacterized membrane-anchored protein